MQNFRFLLYFAAAGLLAAQSANTPQTSSKPARPARSAGALPLSARELLARITAPQLEGDLSFLSSDALAGRFTPSPGLDVAAEFIASRFRAAGLEPAGDDGYFQMAHMIDRSLAKITTPLSVQIGSESVRVPANDLHIFTQTAAAKFADTPAIVFTGIDPASIAGLDLKGKAAVYSAPDLMSLPHDQMRIEYRKLITFSRALRSAGVALEIIATSSPLPGVHARLLSAEEAQKPERPVIVAVSPELSNATRQAKTATVTLDVPPPDDRPLIGRNVIALLRGSDPKLKNTYVLLTAHYDHIGTTATAAGMTTPVKNPTSDKIYNGANDDGSGTVSVVEIAQAFAKLHPHPKRSLVFMTFFGEERGEIGSEYYADHPVFPLSQTIADLNLEQVGRTDATDGKQVNTASLTGFDYSTLTSYFAKAGLLTGIKVYRNPEASDLYFTQSDNAPLARKGVPAETLCVAFDYPDYHGLGDEWQKIDYDNMARVDHMIALGLLHLADAPQPPVWNAANPKTEAFRSAQKELHSGT